MNVFRTAADAMVCLGKKARSGGQIGRVIRGNRKTAFGYVFGNNTVVQRLLVATKYTSSEWKQGESEKTLRDSLIL